MPIQINLLAETQAAEAMRRRDPVKRTIFVGISLAAIFIAWGFFVEVQVFLVNAQIAGIQQKINVKTNNFQTATINMKKIASEKAKMDEMDKLQEVRFLQGNLLDALQHATVDGVQLTKLRLTQMFSTVQHEGANGSPGKSDYIEEISLYMEARDFSANPGDQVNKFTDALGHYPYFETMLGRTNTAHLAGPPSALQGEGSSQYVTFAVECKFPTQKR